MRHTHTHTNSRYSKSSAHGVRDSEERENGDTGAGSTRPHAQGWWGQLGLGDLLPVAPMPAVLQSTSRHAAASGI